MKLPQKTASAHSRVGRYVARRLIRAGLLELTSSVTSANGAVLFAARRKTRSPTAPFPALTQYILADGFCPARVR